MIILMLAIHQGGIYFVFKQNITSVLSKNTKENEVMLKMVSYLLLSKEWYDLMILFCKIFVFFFNYYYFLAVSLNFQYLFFSLLVFASQSRVFIQFVVKVIMRS